MGWDESTQSQMRIRLIVPKTYSMLYELNPNNVVQFSYNKQYQHVSFERLKNY